MLHRSGSWYCPHDPASCHFRARRGSVRAPGVTLSPSPHPDLSSETRGQMWHLGSDVCHLGSPPDLTSQICHLSWPGRGHTRCHIRAAVTRADQQLGTLCPASVLMLIGEIKIKLSQRRMMDLLSAATWRLLISVYCTVISDHNKDSDGEMSRWAPAPRYIYGSSS